MDPRSILVLEKPALVKVQANPEATVVDNLVNEMNQDLAEYAQTHLGYSVLSKKVQDAQKAKQIEVETAPVKNRLAEAILKADISVYNKNSVEKYKKEMVKSAWKKLIFAGSSDVWGSISFISPILALALLQFGVINTWVACVVAFVSQLIALKDILKDGMDANGACSALFIFIGLPIGGIVLTANLSQYWSVMTYVVCLLGLWICVDLTRQKVKGSEISWSRSILSLYGKEVPLFALEKARQIHTLAPATQFFVEELYFEIYIPDPFLVAVDPDSKEEFYFAVWDEPDFEAKNF